jgi:glycosyltransferase involved in cell wall biosynthesis/uridine kinase
VLSVIIPAHNEEARLPITLVELRAHLDHQPEPYEVVVVDDGSTDGTERILRDAATRWRELSVIVQTPNRGKGEALRRGMLEARGDLRLFTDADLSTPIIHLSRLRDALTPTTPIAIASRHAPGAVIEQPQPALRRLMGAVYRRLVRTLVLPGIRDTQCGFKLFTAEAVDVCFGPLRTHGFGVDPELLLRARHHGWTIAEVPVTWHHVSASRVSSVRDSLAMFRDLLRLRRAARHWPPPGPTAPPTVERSGRRLTVRSRAVRTGVDLVVERARELLDGRDHPLMIALDGRSGTGKSTLARTLAQRLGASVVIGDDFWAGGQDAEWDARTPRQRVEEALDWRRLRAQVLEPVAKGRRASWRPFDWTRGEGLSERVLELEPTAAVILDGAYSARWELSDLIDLAVLVEAPEEERRRRLERREGPAYMAAWHRRWDPAEAYYFSDVRPPASFDLVIRN